MRDKRVTALFWQGTGNDYVNYVTPMKAVTYNSATFVMNIIIWCRKKLWFFRR